MEELKVSPKELKNIIENGKILGQGFFGTVFTYQDRLIKLDRNLFSLLHANDPILSRRVIENHYKYEVNDFQNREQIEVLAEKQQDITLTKLPEGIVTLKEVSPRIDGISPGIIIPYHKDHEKLEKLSPSEYKRVLDILKKLLKAVKELADNKISQEDFANYGKDWDINARSYNVMYKDDTPQIIDMSGYFIKVNDQFISAKNMYRDLSNILLDYFYLYGIKSNVARGKITTYEEDEELINRLGSELDNMKKMKKMKNL